MPIIYHQPPWNATDLWSIEVRKDATLAKMNLKLSNVRVNGLRGFGI